MNSTSAWARSIDSLPNVATLSPSVKAPRAPLTFPPQRRKETFFVYLSIELSRVGLGLNSFSKFEGCLATDGSRTEEKKSCDSGEEEETDSIHPPRRKRRPTATASGPAGGRASCGEEREGGRVDEPKGTELYNDRVIGRLRVRRALSPSLSTSLFLSLACPPPLGIPPSFLPFHSAPSLLRSFLTRSLARPQILGHSCVRLLSLSPPPQRPHGTTHEERAHFASPTPPRRRAVVAAATR